MGILYNVGMVVIFFCILYAFDRFFPKTVSKLFGGRPNRTRCEFCGGELFLHLHKDMQEFLVCENHFLGEHIDLLGKKTCVFMDYPFESERFV